MKKKPTKSNLEKPARVVTVTKGNKSKSVPVFSVFKPPTDEEIRGAFEDAKNLVALIRDRLPVAGLRNSYMSGSGAVRQNYEDEAAWLLIRLAKINKPGVYWGIPGNIVTRWDQLGRVVDEIRKHWNWADQDGENRIPCSPARDGVELEPLPEGLLVQLEAATNIDLQQLMVALRPKVEAKSTGGRPKDSEKQKALKIIRDNPKLKTAQQQELLKQAGINLPSKRIHRLRSEAKKLPK